MSEQFIEITQDQPGFNPFFGSFLCQNHFTLLVDTGPAKTGARLTKALSALGVTSLDYILLTHIHIDHAGAVADLLDRFPMARAVCHKAGVDHLIDPEKLWAGSLHVLGETAQMYGKPRPVPRERLIPHDRCVIERLQIIETPGHALHHLSYTFDGRLYAGEAAGNYFFWEGKDYLRPATPPRFFLPTFLKSVDRLLELPDQPIRYAHCGGSEGSKRLLAIFRDQVAFWASVVRWNMEESSSDEQIILAAMDQLLATDPNLAPFWEMEAAIQKREKKFIRTSLNGFLQYLKEKG